MDKKILPPIVTKPVQLLIAWFVGLIVLDAAFLVVAVALRGGWAANTLIIAAVSNVPLFLTGLFLLRVKFSSEFKGGAFRYIDKKTNRVVKITVSELYDIRFSQLQDEIEQLYSQISAKAAAPDWSRWRVALNDNLDSFAEIRKALRDAKIPLASIFGKIDGINPPSKKIVTFNDRLSAECITAILKTLLPFKLDGFKIEDASHEIKDDDCIIGAYGCDTGYAAITDELKDMLARPVEKADLDYYAKSHIVK
jgi:hypothetical protein